MTMATCPTTWDVRILMQIGKGDWSSAALVLRFEETGGGRGARYPFLNRAWPVSTLVGLKPSED